MNKLMEDIRHMHDTEGRVLYFLDSEDSVIGLLKKKSVWYIIIRAMREKIKAYSQTLNQLSKGGRMEIAAGRKKDELAKLNREIPKRMTKRLKEIQKWLNLANGTIDAWRVLFVGFSGWLRDKLVADELVGKDVEHRFPVLWRRYLEETGQSDKVPVAWGGSAEESKMEEEKTS